MNRNDFLKAVAKAGFGFCRNVRGEKYPKGDNEWQKKPLGISDALKLEQSPTHNVGVMPVGELFIVDIDVKDGLEDFKQEFNIRVEPTVSTKRGYHYYFKGVKPTIRDLKSYGEVCREGHQADFGEEKSVNSGEIYDINDYPRLKVELTPLKVSSDKKYSGKFPLTEVKVALSYIKPKDCSFDDWTRIGMALQSEYGDDAFDYYLHWSQREGWDKVDSVAEIEKKWDSFKGSGITIGTLIHYAKEGGYKPPKPDWQNHPVWSEFTLINDENKFYDNKTRNIIADKALYLMIGHRFRSEGIDNYPAPSTAISKGLVDIEVVNSRVYDPRSEEHIFEGNFNKFIHSSMGKSADKYTKEGMNAISLINKHFLFLCKNDENKVKAMLNFFAHIRQRPQHKHLWCLYIVGGQGIGKSGALIDLCKILVGESNLGKIKDKQVESSYNDWHVDRLVNVMPEIKISGKSRKEMYDNLKEEVGDTDTGVQEKYKNHKGLVMSFCNYIICSNHDTAILIEPDDRRLCVIDAPKQAQSKEYYEELFTEALKNEKVFPDIRLYFDKITLPLESDYPKNAPYTEDKESLFQSIREEAEGYEELQDALQDPNEVHINEDYIKQDDFVVYLETSCGEFSEIAKTFKIKSKNIRYPYQRLGYPYKNELRIGDRTVRFRVKNKMKDSEFKEIYEQHKKG